MQPHDACIGHDSLLLLLLLSSVVLSVALVVSCMPICIIGTGVLYDKHVKGGCVHACRLQYAGL